MPIAMDGYDFRKSVDGRHLYICDYCGALSPWGDSWAWFGSYRQLDDIGLKTVEPIMTMCSALCRIKLIAAGKLPDKGLDDVGNVSEI